MTVPSEDDLVILQDSVNLIRDWLNPVVLPSSPPVLLRKLLHLMRVSTVVLRDIRALQFAGNSVLQLRREALNTELMAIQHDILDRTIALVVTHNLDLEDYDTGFPGPQGFLN